MLSIDVMLFPVTQFSTICVAFYILVTGGDSDLKLGR